MMILYIYIDYQSLKGVKVMSVTMPKGLSGCPDISVIMPSYNQTISLKLAFESLLEQDFDGNFELIVCDDGSRVEQFFQLRDLFDAADVSVKYVWQQDRFQRVAETRNNGIRLAKGKILVFLDGDMVPEADLLRKHYDAHTTSKMIVAGNRLWRGLNMIEHLQNQPIVDVLMYLRVHEAEQLQLRSYQEKEQQIRNEWMDTPKEWRICFTCNLSIMNSSEICFDDNFVGYGPEDMELAYRLCKLEGYQPVYREDIISYHLDNPTTAMNVFRRKKPEEIVMYMKNACYFFDKCPGMPLEDVFYGFPKLEFNPQTNTWGVNKERPISGTYDLTSIVKTIRTWLAENGTYNSPLETL